MNRLALSAFALHLVTSPLASAGEPIYFPDISAVSTAEVLAVKSIQPLLAQRMQEEGYIVLDGAVAADSVGGNIANCAMQFTCPGEPLRLLPTRLALVISVSTRSGVTTGTVQVFEQAESVPLDEYTLVVEEEGWSIFVDQVIRGLRDVIALLPERPSSMESAARELSASASTTPGELTIIPAAPLELDLEPAPVEPVAVAEPLERGDYAAAQPREQATVSASAPPVADAPQVAPQAEPVVAEPVRTPANANPSASSQSSIEELLRGTDIEPRHVRGAEGSLERSGLDPRDWFYRATPHAGRAVVELRAGVATGDVDRAADLRVSVSDNLQSGDWYQEAPVVASRLRGGLYFGYAPHTAFDVGAVVGLQYGFRILTTGWLREGEPESETVADPVVVQAAQGYIQPRIRVYPVQVGPLKPFAFFGADFRIVDKYDLNQPETLEYPSPPATAYPGILGGGGLVLDPSPIVGLFLEASFSQYFGYRATKYTFGDWEGLVPEMPGYTQKTIAITSGLQFRL